MTVERRSALHGVQREVFTRHTVIKKIDRDLNLIEFAAVVSPEEASKQWCQAQAIVKTQYPIVQKNSLKGRGIKNFSPGGKILKF